MFLSDQSAKLTRLYYCSSHNKINFKLGRAFGKNERKSAAIFCHQVAACVPDMFCNFYLVKSHKIAYNSATTEAIEKLSTDLESTEFYTFFGVCLTTFENYQILLNKISHRFPMTTKLFTGWKSLIGQITIIICIANFCKKNFGL